MQKGQMVRLRDVYGEALVELGERDASIVVLTADLGGSTRVAEFGQRFPDRYFNMGVAEANMMGTAAGLAMAGMKPFASTFAMFAAGKPWEQIRQVIAYQNAPVRIVATHAGLTVGEDGASHQMLEDINNMRVLPNMRVIVPADAVETRAVVEFLGGDLDGPVYVRLPRAAFPVVLDSKQATFELGRATVLREGSDVSLMAVGLMVSQALKAAVLLADQGLSAEVVNVSTIKPIDVHTITASARRTQAVVTAEEHQVLGGLGSAVSEVLGEHCPVPIMRVGVRDEWGQSGEAYELVEHYQLTAQRICEAALQVVGRKERS